jgi:hypothetical protein
VSVYNPSTGTFTNIFVEGNEHGGVILEPDSGRSSVYQFNPETDTGFLFSGEDTLGPITFEDGE